MVTKKRFWLIVILLMLITAVIIAVSTLPSQTNVDTLFRMDLVDQNDNIFISKNINATEFEFSLDIFAETNKAQKLNIFLLCNYEKIEFSLNGQGFRDLHTLSLQPSSEIVKSSMNAIAIKNLPEGNVDMCFVAVNKYNLFTKRFHFSNGEASMPKHIIEDKEISIQEMKYFGVALNSFVSETVPISSDSIVNIIYDDFYLSCDLYNIMDNSRFGEAFQKSVPFAVDYAMMFLSLTVEKGKKLGSRCYQRPPSFFECFQK